MSTQVIPTPKNRKRAAAPPKPLLVIASGFNGEEKGKTGVYIQDGKALIKEGDSFRKASLAEACMAIPDEMERHDDASWDFDGLRQLCTMIANRLEGKAAPPFGGVVTIVMDEWEWSVAKSCADIYGDGGDWHGRVDRWARQHLRLDMASDVEGLRGNVLGEFDDK